MKTFRLIGMALIAILLSATACSDGGGEDNPITPPTPEKPKSEIKVDSSITTNGVSFSHKAGEQSVSFSPNEKWTLSIAETRSGTAWVTASATSGNAGNVTITFKVTENTDYEDRSVSITIKAGTATITFKITQKGVDAMLVTTTTYEVPQEGATIDIEVQANIDYTMEISEAAKGWITEASSRALKTNKHSLKIAANEEYDKREGEIYFKSGDKKETVHVYQTGGAIILLSQNEFTVSDKGETISVEIKSNCEYGVQMPDVDWIIDESSRGASSHTLKYTIEANEGYDSRSAQIIYFDKNSEFKDTLTINQVQKDVIILGEKNIKINHLGGDFEVKVQSNINLDIIIPDIDWLKTISTRGLSEYKFMYTVEPNYTEEDRKTIIVFKNKETLLSDTITVLQKRELILDIYKGGEYLFAYLEGERNLFSVSTNEEIKVTSSDWIIIDKIEKPDPSVPSHNTIEFHVSKNMGDQDRLGSIVISIDDNNLSKAVHVRQYCNPVSINEGCLTIHSDALYYKDEKSLLQSACIDKELDLYSIKELKATGWLGDRDYGFMNALASNYNLSKIDLSKLYYGNNIPNRAFEGCKQLETIALPDSSYYAYGFCAFIDCENLIKVIPPKPIIKSLKMDSGCFRGCSSLSTITIPENVISIETQCFYLCTSLKEIHCMAATPPVTTNSAFNGKDFFNNVILYVPKGSKILYETSAGWSSFKNIIEE